MANASFPPYPILAACIAQDRPPRLDEVNRVARRILREGSIGAAVARIGPRAALRAARVALAGAGA
jgi:hypothetical protein